MAKGSQLSQLKSSLSKAGLTGQQNTGKKRKRTAVTTEKDKNRKAARLEEINRKLNPFDTKVTKLKHDTAGRKLKGVSGKPSDSKQAALDQRKQALAKESESKHRAGGVLDRRFGENDPTMSVEERMLERFIREKKRTSKGSAFNLEEEELTHYGQSLSKLDDFDGADLGLREEDEEEEEYDDQLDQSVVRNTHFSGFNDDEEEDDDEDQPARKKSKAEVMAEVIAKSKQHKMLRQIEQEKEENLRHELDLEFDNIKDLILSAPDPSSTGSNSMPLGLNRRREQTEVDHSAVQDQYDANVRELAFDKRAKPKDRTKTEEEIALEEKNALEAAERRRKRRMLGEDVDSDEEEAGRGKKRKRERGGDDLEDDFDGGLGAGLEDGSEADSDEDDVDEGASEKDPDDGEDEDEDEDEDEEDGSEGEQTQPGPSSVTPRKSKTKPPESSLPFTFKCPENHEDFEEILEGVTSSDVVLVVQRIRTLYHPSLGPDNKTKLQTFTTVLIDHVLHQAAASPDSFDTLMLLEPHLSSLIRSYPVSSAQHFMQKLNIFHKNLKRGLSSGALDLNARTFPGIAELSFLRLIGHVWSTSDLNHAVVSPARVLMGAYLGLCRVRCFKDLASGLFLCTLFLQYEAVSKRLVPEALNFLVNALLHLAPHQYSDLASVPGSFSSPDFDSASCRTLRIDVKHASVHQKTHGTRQIDIVRLLATDVHNEEDKIDLLSLTLTLLGRYADMYKGLDGFIDLFAPILEMLDSLEIKFLKAQKSELQTSLGRLLKFAFQSRQPLFLQAHKPIAIPSYIPKFESSSSSYLRRQDPDHERNEAAKLRHQYKEEKKGAIRELRKDAKFLAGVQHQEIKDKDKQYNQRMKRVFGEIEGERAEEKKAEREKAKEKRRSGRK